MGPHPVVTNFNSWVCLAAQFATEKTMWDRKEPAVIAAETFFPMAESFAIYIIYIYIETLL